MRQLWLHGVSNTGDTRKNDGQRWVLAGRHRWWV
jgi:hypothetical protein